MAPKNYYQILEVTRDVSERELKRAYHKLAKALHPDKASSSEATEHLEQQMALVSQAYNTLKDPKRREEYNSTLTKEQTRATRHSTSVASDRGEAHHRRATIASKALAKGIHLMKAGEYQRAVEFLEAALENNPEDAKAHIRLAEALMLSKKGFSRATKHAEKAIEMDPWNVQFRLVLGDLYEKAGVKSRAIEVYEEALRWDQDSGMIKAKLSELKGGLGGGSLAALIRRLLGRGR